jgi:hypothetical protein
MGRPSIESDRSLFLQTLKSLGSKNVGNVTLRNELDWDEPRYWRTQGLLFEDEAIVRGKGKGGSVTIASNDTWQANVVKTPSAEKELYEPALEQILNGWKEFHEYDAAMAEICAMQGRRETGGTWTRPDIAMVATRSFEFIPQRVFDIISFEIKTSDNINIQSVFEASQHKRFAMRAFLLAAMDEDHFEKLKEADRIKEEAKKHGVGVILAPNITQFGTWSHLLPSIRHEPDPKEADKFIRQTFTTESKTEIVKWQK